MNDTGIGQMRVARRRRTLAWWEPRWSYWPRFLRETRSTGILRTRFWVRVLAASALLGALIVAGIVLAYPGVVIPWRQVLLIPLLLAGCFGAFIALYLAIPPRMEIKPAKLVLVHGEHAIHIRRDDLVAATLDASIPSRATLHLRYRDRCARERDLTVGIGRHVDLSRLGELLEDKLQLAARQEETAQPRP